MKNIILVVTAIILVHTGYCQKITLDDAIALALKNKPAMSKAKLDEEIAQQQLDESIRKYTPEITGELTLQYNPVIPTSIIPLGQFNTQNPTDETRPIQFGQPWSNTTGIRGKQVLYSPALRNEVKEKKLDVDKAMLSSISETEKITYEVSKSYYSILLAEEELKFAISDTSRAFELHQIAYQRYEKRQIKEVERKQAEYNLVNSRYQFLKIKSNLENAKLNLLYSIGLPQNSQIKTTTILSSISINEADKIDSSIQYRADYRKATIENEIYKQQITTERSKLFPQISLNAFLGANQFTNTFNPTESNTWFGISYVNINASFPLSGFYTQNKKIQQIKSRFRQSELELIEIVQKYEYERKVALNNFEASLKDYQNQSASLKLSKQIYEDVVNRFKEGQSLSSDVQMAVTDIQASQFRTSKALYEVLLYQLELDRLNGFKRYSINQ